MRIPYVHVRPHIPTAVGTQVRVDHEACPSGRDTKQRLYIKRTPLAVLAYCHNCGGHMVRKAPRTGVRQPEVIERLLRESEADTTAGVVALPEDFVGATLAPDDAKAWLYGYNITDEDIKKYNIGYSESWGRIILPVFEDGKCVFWQGRAVEGATPKYISVQSAKKPLFVASDPSHDVWTAVITEDMLSAIRVTPVDRCFTGYALLGTHGPDDLAEQLKKYTYVFVWLDNDTAGRRKGVELTERLKTCAPVTQQVIQVSSSHPEPKRLTARQILEVSQNRGK